MRGSMHMRTCTPTSSADSSMLRSLSLLLLGACAPLVAALGETLGAVWPTEPVGKTAHARLLQETLGPTVDQIAEYNFILFSSIIIAVCFYFAIMAMVNMDFETDPLLYSKSKGD